VPADDFLDRYRRALQEAAGAPIELDDDAVEAILDLARDVAHGSERRHAPLATFLAGQFVNAGATDPKALQKASALARQLLGPPDQ
jgi:hypothetical protein